MLIFEEKKMSVNTIDLSCFDDIIGVSHTTCDCFPDDTDTSLSGLWLDELEGLNTKAFNDLEICEKGDIWDRFRTSIENAKYNFITDVNGKLHENFATKRKPYIGGIGRVKYTVTKTLSNTYAVVRFYCAPVKSGVIRIKKVNAIFSQTGTKDITIYDSFGTSHGTFTINTTANTPTETTITTLELPMYSEYIDNLEYFFVYEVDTNYPKDNDLTCNCGNKPAFNIKHPSFNQSSLFRNYGWAAWIMVGSYTADTLDFNDPPSTASNYMLGLSFDLDLTCNTYETICKEVIDFQNNPNAMGLAHAIRYKAGALLLTDLISSDELNRTTMLDKETSVTNLEYYETKYKELIDYLGKKIDITANDCFKCKEITQMMQGGIFL